MSILTWIALVCNALTVVFLTITIRNTRRTEASLRNIERSQRKLAELRRQP